MPAILGELTAIQANAIFNIAEDAIISIDASQRIIFFNNGAERIFGYPASEVLGKQLEMLIPEANRKKHAGYIDRFRHAKNSSRRMGERGEITGQRKNFSLFPAEASICTVGKDNEQIFTVILRDISARKARNDELEKAKEEAESADYAKSMFLANMSHEIRTPLNAVVGMTSLLMDTQLSTEQKDCANTIRSSSEALLAIINDILDYSKIEVGKLDLEYQPFDLRNCIEESLDLLSSIAAEKQLNLAYMIDDGVPALVVSDITRLRQIMVNLLSNATKFTQRGEVIVSVKVLAVEADSFELQFSVSDTGIGISPEHIDHLFKSFSQLDVSTTRKYGGTGLGLAISKRLAEIMGGKMWVESEPGHGSTFYFSIQAEAAGEDLARSFLQEHAIQLTGKRLLIVDDIMTNRRILVKQSLLWGMKPTATASGVEAMDLVRHGDAFDLVILDMSMPEMDGLELARQIREYRTASSLPLIMLSSMSQRPNVEVMEELQFSAFLNKPIKASQLFEVFKTSLGMDNAAGTVEPKNGFDISLAERNPLTILIVEDNAINQKVVQLILQKFGYQSDLVFNGVEALEALDRRQYDLVLMDLHMPEMDGLEATREIIHRLSSSVRPKIVAMTANVQPSDRNACLKAGMDDFLAKPIEAHHLHHVLETTNRKYQANDADARTGNTVDIDLERIDIIRLSQDNDDPDLLASIIDMFVSDANERIAVMQSACAATDWQTLEDEAHRFYSSCSALGLIRMTEICGLLEMHAEDIDINKSDLLIELNRAYEQILPELLRQKNT